METKGEGMKKAFTMIELVMVIVILGVLSSVAISKMALTRDDAIITKGRSQVSSIRSAISLLRSKNMMSGKMSNGGYPPFLDDEHVNHDGKLFDGNSSIGKLLDYPVYDKAPAGQDIDGNWEKDASNQYHYTAMKKNVTFKYIPSTGVFDCNHSSSDAKIKELCKSLTE